jgi:hypothetical protein
MLNAYQRRGRDKEIFSTQTIRKQMAGKAERPTVGL